MLRYEALATGLVNALRQGGPDSYGCVAQRAISDGEGNPCRHCLDFIPSGTEMLIVAHRPFVSLQPYAETGPIFLCATHCLRHRGDSMPPILKNSVSFLLKGYSREERIVYGTGRVVLRNDLISFASGLLKDSRVAFVDVRSARNNCFQLRLHSAS